MIKNQKKIRQFEKKYKKEKDINIEHNFSIIEALLAEAVELGVLPLKQPLEGLETDIRIARIVNSVPKTD
ncbi:MAG: hypothetical protein ACOC6P_02350 [Candidatus Aminicenantaceae bacterium]